MLIDPLDVQHADDAERGFANQRTAFATVEDAYDEYRALVALRGTLLELQRLLNLCLPHVPVTDDRLKGEILAALSIRPNG